MTPRIHQDGVGGLAKIEYSVAEHGGKVGANPIPLKLPAGAIVTKGLVKVTEPFTSGGAATVAFTCNTAGDLLAATAIASVTGKLDLIPENDAATSVETTAERQLALTVATAALTGGAATVWLWYLEP